MRSSCANSLAKKLTPHLHVPSQEPGLGSWDGSHLGMGQRWSLWLISPDVPVECGKGRLGGLFGVGFVCGCFFCLFGFFFLVLIKQFLHSPCQFLFQMYQHWFNREGCTAAPNAKNTGRAPCFHLTCSYFSFVLSTCPLSSNNEVQSDCSSCWERLLGVRALSSLLQSLHGA